MAVTYVWVFVSPNWLTTQTQLEPFEVAPLMMQVSVWTQKRLGDTGDIRHSPETAVPEQGTMEVLQALVLFRAVT